MATITTPTGTGAPNAAQLSTAQTGNGASTNIADRRDGVGPALLTLVTTVGATPTVTIAIEGSVDGLDWWPAPYADAATPETPTVATFAITTAGTVRKILRPGHPWRYLRLTYSANTNVTTTATVTMF